MTSRRLHRHLVRKIGNRNGFRHVHFRARIGSVGAWKRGLILMLAATLRAAAPAAIDAAARIAARLDARGAWRRRPASRPLPPAFFLSGDDGADGAGAPGGRLSFAAAGRADTAPSGFAGLCSVPFASNGLCRFPPAWRPYCRRLGRFRLLRNGAACSSFPRIARAFSASAAARRFAILFLLGARLFRSPRVRRSSGLLGRFALSGALGGGPSLRSAARRYRPSPVSAAGFCRLLVGHWLSAAIFLAGNRCGTRHFRPLPPMAAARLAAFLSSARRRSASAASLARHDAPPLPRSRRSLAFLQLLRFLPRAVSAACRASFFLATLQSASVDFRPRRDCPPRRPVRRRGSSRFSRRPRFLRTST